MNLNIKIPESWNSLTDKQLKNIAFYFYAYEGKKQDLLIFKELLNVRCWKLRKLYQLFRVLSQTSLDELKEFYSWLYDDITLTRFIPKLKAKNEVLFSAQDRISNFSVYEFSHTEDLFLLWNDKKDFSSLRYLAAVIYREQIDGKRSYFDKSELQARGENLSKLNKKTLLAILLSYQGCRRYLFNQYPYLFPEETGKKKKKVPKSSGFGKLILKNSGKKFGTHDETKNTNVYVFLSEIEDQLKNPKDD